jgi:hypothetical protein
MGVKQTKAEGRYYIDKSRSIRKSVIIYEISGSVHSPIMYLQKPKWVSQERFEKFLEDMVIMVNN